MRQNFLAVLLLLAGLLISSILIVFFPKNWITIITSVIVFILAIARPNIGIVMLLALLYLPIFPNVPIGSFEFSVSTIPVLALFIAALGRLINGQAKPLTGWQALILFSLFVLFGIATITSTLLSSSLNMVPNLAIYLMILISMFVLIDKPQQITMVVYAILIFTILLFLYRWNVFYIKTGAVFLGFQNIGGSNAVAMWALPAIAICTVGVLLQPSIFSNRMRLVLLGELAFLVVNLIIFQTRGAWLAAAVGFILVLTCIRKPRLLFASLFVIAVLLGLFYLYQPILNANTVQTDTSAHAFFGSENYQDINTDDQIRLYSRDAGLKMFWEKPYLGWGVDTFDKVKPRYYEGPTKQLQAVGAFNSWLWILGDMGILGVTVIAIIFLTPFVIAWVKRMYRSDGVPTLAFALALGVVELSIHLFFIDLIYTSFIWMQLALAIASVRLFMQRETENIPVEKIKMQPARTFK